jgi:hypothetical protein
LTTSLPSIRRYPTAVLLTPLRCGMTAIADAFRYRANNEMYRITTAKGASREGP